MCMILYLLLLSNVSVKTFTFLTGKVKQKFNLKLD